MPHTVDLVGGVHALPYVTAPPPDPVKPVGGPLISQWNNSGNNTFASDKLLFSKL